MEFTGERYVPGVAGLEELYIEHMSRYRFVRTLAVGRRVLDVGSGCGYGTYDLAAAGAEMVLGVDISPEAVAYSRRNYRHPVLLFALMDACRLSLEGGFDLVTCFELIEHVEDAEGILEGVHRVLNDSGIFVVSTPNKATYVAGGEGGSNPFHVREYYIEEFRDLLGATFPAVEIFGQQWLEGTALVPHPAPAGPGEIGAGSLPYEGDAPLAHPDGRGTTSAPYFIALCAKQPIPEGVRSGLCPVAFYGAAVRYEGLKRAVRDLEREFDRRGEWAMRLDREVRSRDNTILRLRRELGELRNRFDERGEWTERLNAELRQSGALVERRAEENRRLRESRACRKQPGFSKVRK
jgi:SAM-dependent methyltransferase